MCLYRHGIMALIIVYEGLSLLKSVQSTLSHLQSPPEQMQSQRNYGSFLSKSHLHGMILLTILSQNRPKSKDNAI